jgi:hypothetical protein
VITLSGTTTASGITYQWQDSPTGAVGSFTDIAAATTALYNTPVLAATTYYRCVVSCTSSSLSDTSTVATVTINPLPSVAVSPAGGGVCAGGGGLSMTASAAATYTWAPAAGLSATTGITVVANPTSTTTYTVSGTDAMGCTGTNTVSVSYNLNPGPISITPASLSVCAGAAPQFLTAAGGLVGPTTVLSGTITIPGSIAAFGTISTGLLVAGIPAGATITGASVNVISFGSQYQDDYIINVRAPNGNILNLIKQVGSHTSTVTTLFSNTNISSSGISPLSSGAGTFTGTWRADAVNAVGSAPFTSNVTNWASLYSIPNGTWTLSIFNNTGFINTVVTSAQWSVTLEYSYQSPVIWSPVTNLYTDAAGTIPYTGTATNDVYADPAVATTVVYTATATNISCTANATVAVTVNPLPDPIGGVLSVCAGATTTLNCATTGGTWATGSANANIDAATGIVTGVTAGTAVISYILPTGCYSTAVVTVNALPPAITGAGTICMLDTATLYNTVAGGTWVSGNSNATADLSSGLINGVTSGTSVITYTLSTGCYSTYTVTINPIPGAIGGLSEVCEGSGINLTNPVSGGTWASSNANSTVDALTGLVTGVTGGTSVISYTNTFSCFVTHNVTVNSLPPAIAGAGTVCEGASITLTNSGAGGTWSTTNTNVSVGSTSGVVTGIVAGTAVITYTLLTSCYNTMTITVNVQPASISGLPFVCEGYSTPLGNSITGGSWTSSNANANVDGVTGVVTGVSAGTADIVYTLANGCQSTLNFTVNMVPAAITGGSRVCDGAALALGSTTTGGSWSCSNGNITIGSATGLVAGVTAGTSVVTYTIANGCFVLNTVTVDPLPSFISGPSVVCQSYTITLLNVTTGGTWSSSNGNITIDPATGVAMGAAAGTATITYALGTGCYRTTNATVNALPAAITGPTEVCVAAGITLNSTTTPGTWTSTNTTVNVGFSTGVVTGVSAGTAVVTYQIATGCYTTYLITVNPLPSVITGSTGICTGLTTTLSSLPSGGTWSSSNANATAALSTGVVSGVSVGTSNITYTLPSGCYRTATVTINLAPGAIAGILEVCEASMTTLSNATTGGTWSSGSTGTAVIDATGLVTGVSPGTADISYTLGNGCVVTGEVTVLPIPAAIAGPVLICEGATVLFTNGTGGGTWSSSNLAVATIDIVGNAFGVDDGVTNIIYTLPNGCAAVLAVTINPLPGPITGSLEVCAGFASNLSNATSGGTWASGSPGVATINSGTGVVTAITTGTTMVTYGLPTGCIVLAEVTVNPLPPVITGAANVCAGASTTLANAIPGGVWSGGSVAVATVNPVTGVVAGLSAGMATVSYTISNGCFNIREVTVNPLPAAITGVETVCEGSTITLSSASPGGVWSSGSIATASVAMATGIVTGILAGTANITYALPTNCYVTRIVTINPSPAVVLGDSTICIGSGSALTNTFAGGIWSSSNTAVATIGSTGYVSGIALGTSVVSYTLPVTGCLASVIVTINPLPAVQSVSGGGNYCAGGVGVSIGLASTDAGISYTLHLGTGVAGFIPGTGTAITFGLQTVPGTYSVIATDALTGCQRGMSGTAVVVVNPLVTPMVSIATSGTGTDTSCNGTTVVCNTVLLNAGAAPTFVWKVNGVVVGTGVSYAFIPASGDVVSVKLTSNAACLATDSALSSCTLTVLPVAAPSVTLSASPNDTVCEHGTATLTAVSGFGGSLPSYTWLRNGTVAGTGTTLTFVPADGDLVSCRMISNYQCRLTDTANSPAVTMTVLPFLVPVVAISANPSVSIVPGQTATLTATVANAGASPTYQWYLNNVPIAGATDTTYVSSTFADLDAVTCEVTSSGICGGLTSFNILYMSVKPTAGIQATAAIADIQLYPNPNNGRFSVSGFLGSTFNETVSIVVTDVVGKVIYSSEARVENGKVNSAIEMGENIVNGMYFLKISPERGSWVRSFIIAK